MSTTTTIKPFSPSKLGRLEMKPHELKKQRENICEKEWQKTKQKKGERAIKKLKRKQKAKKGE